MNNTFHWVFNNTCNTW